MAADGADIRFRKWVLGDKRMLAHLPVTDPPLVVRVAFGIGPASETGGAFRRNMPEVAAQQIAQPIVDIRRRLARPLDFTFVFPAEMIEHLEIEFVNEPAVRAPHVQRHAVRFTVVDGGFNALSAVHCCSLTSPEPPWLHTNQHDENSSGLNRSRSISKLGEFVQFTSSF